jgi:hypothetical protein
MNATIILGLVWLLTMIMTYAFAYGEGKDKGTQEGYYLGKQEAKKADPKFKEIKRKK